jgi:hypothetical protein
MTMMQTLRLLSLISILDTAVAQQPRLAGGFSSPAITWMSETTCQLSDSFDGDFVDANLWFAFFAGQQSQYGAFINVTDGEADMYTGLTPADEEANPIGFFSQRSFDPQSFTLTTSISVESYEGVSGFGVGVHDRMGESRSEAFLVGMGVMLRHAPPDYPGPFADGGIIVFDGTVTPGLDFFLVPELFSKLKGNTTDIIIDYDHGEGQMSVTITGPRFNFSVNRPGVYPNDRAVIFHVGGSFGGNYVSEDRIKVDNITTTFEWVKPGRFEASLSPLDLDRVVYNGDGFEFPSPNTVFLTNTSQPTPIMQDGTVVPADGVTSYNLALVTILEDLSHPPSLQTPIFATVITYFSEMDTNNIPDVRLTVDAFLENAYVAQGAGNDFLISIAEGAEAELLGLSEIIVPGFGPGKSLPRPS